jgi:hypothetical protein
MALFRSGTIFCYYLFLFNVSLLRMVNAHAGIISPESMKVTIITSSSGNMNVSQTDRRLRLFETQLGKLFTDQCGEQAASIISRAPVSVFILTRQNAKVMKEN